MSRFMLKAMDYGRVSLPHLMISATSIAQTVTCGIVQGFLLASGRGPRKPYMVQVMTFRCSECKARALTIILSLRPRNMQF